MIPCQARGCNKTIEYNGALLFSPPDKNNNTQKVHICKDCYLKIVSGLLDNGLIIK